MIQNEDHNSCITKYTSYNDENKEYWECRLKVINQRIYNNANNYDGHKTAYKNEILKMRKEIKSNIKEIDKRRQKILDYNEKKEHDYCTLFKTGQEQYSNAYNYYSCRNKIKDLNKNKDNYLDLTNATIFKIFQQNEQTEKKSKSILIQNECVKYASNVDKLEKCEEALKRIEKCSKEIDLTIQQRKINDSEFCIRDSIEKYPDSLATFENKNDTSIDSLNNDKVALTSGILLMSGPKTSKINLIELRDKAYNDCMRERKKKLDEYNLYLLDQCRIKNLKVLEEK